MSLKKYLLANSVFSTAAFGDETSVKETTSEYDVDENTEKCTCNEETSTLSENSCN